MAKLVPLVHDYIVFYYRYPVLSDCRLRLDRWTTVVWAWWWGFLGPFVSYIRADKLLRCISIVCLSFSSGKVGVNSSPGPASWTSRFSVPKNGKPKTITENSTNEWDFDNRGVRNYLQQQKWWLQVLFFLTPNISYECWKTQASSLHTLQNRLHRACLFDEWMRHFSNDIKTSSCYILLQLLYISSMMSMS